MCEDCGCGDARIVPLKIQAHLLSGNDQQAAHNRSHFLEAGVTAVNLMGSPGSGKTAVLEATARRLGDRRKLQAVSGDLATENDAKRLEKSGIPSRAITTGNACHLDADMVHRAMHHMPIHGTDYFFIENVGNLVCPSVYDLGQTFNAVALAVTEGEDKPLKYPPMFLKADIVLITKIDLLPHLDVHIETLIDNLAKVMPAPRWLAFSSRTGEGVDGWIDYLESHRLRVASPLVASRTAR